MADVRMPRLSPSMQEGTIVRWLKSDGDAVAAGEELAEVDTGEAELAVAAPEDGVLTIVASTGATVPVGEPIGRIVPAGAAALPPDGDAPPPTALREPGARGETRREEPTRPQQALARRVAESKATAPDAHFTVSVDMDAVVALRAELAAAAPDAPALEDFVVRAAALALRDVPQVNGAYRDGGFERYARVNVGLVVEGGEAPVVPTIFDADRKSLQEVAQDARALAERVRAGTITPPEVAGATFTVWSLAASAVTRFAAVLIPPQAAILAVGALESRAVVRDFQVLARPTLDLTLTCDHRILYGATAAAFLGRVRERLEHPLQLLG